MRVSLLFVDKKRRLIELKAALSDFAVDFNEGSLSGKVSFTAPTTLFIGIDMLLPVDNVAFNYRNGVSTLTWDAASATVNGGYFDPAGVSYTVTRYPDAVVVSENQKETTFTESYASESFVSLYYTVAVSYNGEQSEATPSNAVSLGIIMPPYSNDFEDADALEGYTQINLNAEGLAVRVVSVDGRTVYAGKGSNAMNIPVAEGIYVVKAGKKVEKVIVK